MTGAPGTGKTTISHLLAKSLQAKYINPGNILGRRGLHEAYDKKRRTQIVSPERLRKLVSSLAAEDNRGLVIDSHIAFEISRPLRLERVIVLRCHPRVLETRLGRKHWSKRKINENLLAEILDICLWDAVHNYGWSKIAEIDTANTSPSHVVDLAIRDLKTKRIPKQRRVDWLSTLKREGTLAHYLK